MHKKNRIHFDAILVILLTFLSFSIPKTGWSDRPLPYFDLQTLTPYWEFESKKDNQTYVPATVNSLNVVDQNGTRVTEQSLNGKISLVNFFFCKCGSICPVMMLTIQKLQKQLKQSKSVWIYSFSVMPENDTPKVLGKYAKMRKIDLSQWSLLTGDRTEIYRVGREIFKADGAFGKTDASSFIHTTNIYVLDDQRRIRGIYDTKNREQMELLTKDVLKLATSTKTSL